MTYTKNHNQPMKYYECIQALNDLVVQGYLPVTDEECDTITVCHTEGHIVGVAEALYHSKDYQKRFWIALSDLSIEPEFYSCDSILAFEEEYERCYKDASAELSEYVLLEKVLNHLTRH